VAARFPVFIFLGANPLHTGLYVNVVNLMERAGFRVDLVVNQLLDFRHPIRNIRERRHIVTHIIGPSRTAIQGRLFGPIPFHYRAKTPYSLFLLGLALPPYLARRRLVFHARTLHVADAALRLKRFLPRLRVIAELEGDIQSELLYSIDRSRLPRGRSLERRMRRHFEATERVLRDSDAVLCVSNQLKNVLAERHGLPPRRRDQIAVFPTLVSASRFYFSEEKRTRVRRDLGLDNRFVVAYAGNLATPWQLPGETVDLFCVIKRLRPEACLLILAPEPDHEFILPHLRRAGVAAGDYQLRSIPYSNMPGVLAAADVGVVLRERHLMNEVASPGKVGEYLLSGLPVIMTESVGEYPAQLSGTSLALVLPDLSQRAALERAAQAFCARDFTSEQRLAFSHWAAQHFSLESRAPLLQEIYRSLSGG
jgi:hypothetical protein